jgi:hypothetical protein
VASFGAFWRGPFYFWRGGDLLSGMAGFIFPAGKRAVSLVFCAPGSGFTLQAFTE